MEEVKQGELIFIQDEEREEMLREIEERERDGVECVGSQWFCLLGPWEWENFEEEERKEEK